MKKYILLAVMPIAAFIVFTAETASDNGKAGYTGSPNELLCNDCHDAYALNSGGGSVVLSSANMNNWEYIPGQTYNMTLTVARNGSPLFGLGLEALDATDNNAGTLTITDAASTHIKNKLVGTVTRHNVVHQLDGGATPNSKDFNFSWTAPATDIGPVTFYFAGVASNADGDETIGDYVYNGTQVINPANTTSVGNLSSESLSVYPNPATDRMAVRVNGGATVRLLDNSGREVRSLRSENDRPETLEMVQLELLPRGLYFLEVQQAGTRRMEKVILQ
jgi:hypothetical protein